VARIACCSAFAVALARRLRLDSDRSGDQIMTSKSPAWIWVVLAVLALLVIGYVVTPPAVIQQATALWSWG